MNLSKNQISQLENQLAVAIRQSDIHFLEQVLHDELLFLAPGGQVITKAMDLASHKAGDMVVEQLAVNIEDIRIMDDTAVVMVVYDTKGSMLGNPIEGKFRYIRIWKQLPQGMMVIGGSCMKI